MPPSYLEAIAIAFIASAESLLSPAAVDKLHSGERTDFDRELAAQGFCCCFLLNSCPV
ncbi:SulP family inorganic anion transporter [Scytonema sp. NUACC26]|uniref:SulP family inorganic anion transporter n=1 Tax=Scytonema sp. NUACC26 TaxID=3140176 RepID=UPI0034DC8FAA